MQPGEGWFGSSVWGSTSPVPADTKQNESSTQRGKKGETLVPRHTHTHTLQHGGVKH